MKNTEQLKNLAKELERDQMAREATNKKASYVRFIFVALALLSLLVIFLGMQAYRNRDLTDSDLKAYTQSLLASESDFFFRWTLDDIKGLTLDDSGNKGSELKTILSNYGKPSDVQVLPEYSKSDGFQIVYLSNKYDYSIPYQKLSLSFKKINGVFRLFSREAEGELTRDLFLAKWDTVFNWTKTDVESLKLSNPIVTDPEGTKYQDIVAKHGLPNKVDYTITDHMENIFVIYYQIGAKDWEKGDHVSLLFSGFEGGETHLVSGGALIGGEKIEK